VRVGVLVDDCLAMLGMSSWDSSMRSCVMLSDDELSLLSLLLLCLLFLLFLLLLLLLLLLLGEVCSMNL